MPLHTPAESAPEHQRALHQSEQSERRRQGVTCQPRVLVWQARREFGPQLYGYPADAQVCCASHPHSVPTPKH